MFCQRNKVFDMAKKTKIEVLDVVALRRLTRANYDRAEAYDFTRNKMLNGVIDWESNVPTDRIFRKDCEQLANKFNDYVKEYSEFFADLEFVGPVVLGNYSYSDAWVEHDKRRIIRPIIGANLAVRNTKTGKLEMLNRNSWFVHREWLSSYGSMLVPFFKTMRLDNVKTGFNFDKFILAALQSRVGR